MATYSFDCTNLIIQLTDTGELDMRDLYSRWKDEILSGGMSACFQAIRVVKEPLSGSTFLGPYYFTMNDWQIRPVDTNHELIVTGTVLQDATSTANSFKVDDLTASVSIVRQVAVEVQVIETGVSGLTAEESDALTNMPDTLWDTVIVGRDSPAGSAAQVVENTPLIVAVKGDL